jgi:tetratricopeptide (TPR) repeat protein
MSVKDKKRYESLLKNEEFHTLLVELEGNNDPYELFLKGIAYYKTNQAEKANQIFEELHQNFPSNEISAYLIITKLKLNDIMAASKLYNELCFEENKDILADIKENHINQAINRCLFLQSIPVERPQLDPAKTVEEDITNSNYQAALQKLHAIAPQKSCDCC